jgi:hypothetical protein
MASKDNFFKSHWDWLVAGGGMVLFAVSAVVFIGRLGTSPEDGAMRCEARLKAARPAHEGVAPADMTVFQSVFRTAKTPPSLVEVDSKRGNFLASDTRIVCKAEKDASGKAQKSCGRPIPMNSQKCPFCAVVQDTGVTKEEEGVKKMREWSARYGVNLALRPDEDSDGDGYTDMEEFEAAQTLGRSTNPKDAMSHPDYLDSLFVEGEIKQTMLPFYLQSLSPVRNGFRYNFRDFSKKDAYGQQMVYRVLKGEKIGNTGYTVGNHMKNVIERVVPGSKGKLKRKVEVVSVELVRNDGRKIVAAENERRVPVDSQATLVFRRGDGKRFVVKQGDEITLYKRTYKILSFGENSKNPEVKILDVTAKTESLITASGRKQQ